jgi:hypothetical protein
MRGLGLGGGGENYLRFSHLDAAFCEFGGKFDGEAGIGALGGHEMVSVFADFEEQIGLFHMTVDVVKCVFPGILVVSDVLRFEANLRFTFFGAELVEVVERLVEGAAVRGLVAQMLGR